MICGLMPAMAQRLAWCWPPKTSATMHPPLLSCVCALSAGHCITLHQVPTDTLPCCPMKEQASRYMLDKGRAVLTCLSPAHAAGSAAGARKAAQAHRRPMRQGDAPQANIHVVEQDNFSSQMEHLACYFPGNVALGVHTGAVKGAKAALYLEAAKNLTATCWHMYAKQPTGGSLLARHGPDQVLCIGCAATRSPAPSCD